MSEQSQTDESATISCKMLETKQAGSFQSVGGGIGLAVLSAIFNDSVKTGFTNLPPAVLESIAKLIEAAAAASNSTSESHSNSGSGSSSSVFDPAGLIMLPAELREPIVGVYLVGLQRIFRWATPFGAIACVVCLFLKRTRVMTAEEMQKGGPAHYRGERERERKNASRS
jgi:hypothetical protein